jgi:hypothetical protein
MARHAQPRLVAELKGAHKKDPQRYRGEELKSDGPLGSAPERLTELERQAWDELSAGSLPGVLTASDRLTIELASVLLAEFWTEKANMAAAKMGQLIGLLARLGMSPADRQKFTKDKSDDDNPYANLSEDRAQGCA